MKNTHTNKLNIKLFKKTLKKSLQSAFKSLSNDVGDKLFNFERLQLKENKLLWLDRYNDPIEAYWEKVTIEKFNLIQQKNSKR